MKDMLLYLFVALAIGGAVPIFITFLSKTGIIPKINDNKNKRRKNNK